MDQRGQRLLVSISDLPRVARTQCVPATWYSFRRERRGACTAKGRTLSSGDGARAIARERVSARFRANSGGFLHAADHPRFRLCAGRPGHVPEFSVHLRLGANAWRPCRRCGCFRAAQPPRGPIEHARRWVLSRTVRNTEPVGSPRHPVLLQSTLRSSRTVVTTKIPPTYLRQKATLCCSQNWLLPHA